VSRDGTTGATDGESRRPIPGERDVPGSGFLGLGAPKGHQILREDVWSEGPAVVCRPGRPDRSADEVLEGACKVMGGIPTLLVTAGSAARRKTPRSRPRGQGRRWSRKAKRTATAGRQTPKTNTTPRRAWARGSRDATAGDRTVATPQRTRESNPETEHPAHASREPPKGDPGTQIDLTLFHRLFLSPRRQRLRQPATDPSGAAVGSGREAGKSRAVGSSRGGRAGSAGGFAATVFFGRPHVRARCPASLAVVWETVTAAGAHRRGNPTSGKGRKAVTVRRHGGPGAHDFGHGGPGPAIRTDDRFGGQDPETAWRRNGELEPEPVLRGWERDFTEGGCFGSCSPGSRPGAS
jgi:hypothetical protein